MRMFEGSGTRFVRPGRDAQDKDWETVQAKFEIAKSELPRMTLELVHQKLDGLATEMARGVAQRFYASLSAAIDAGAGVLVDAEGKPLTADNVLDLFGRMAIEFTPGGRPKWPEMHVGPDLAETAARTVRDLQENPELAPRLAALVEHKREEWRAREASRSLVG